MSALDSVIDWNKHWAAVDAAAKEHTMHIYLAGPMSGVPKFNFPLFHEVAHALRERGWIVANPAEHDLEMEPTLEYEPGFEAGDLARTHFDLAAALDWDVQQILHADAIVLLPYWIESQGAQLERLVAERTGRLVLLAERNPLGQTEWEVRADPNQRRMHAALNYELQGERRDVLNAQGEPVDAPVSPDPAPLGSRRSLEDVRLGIPSPDADGYDYRARVRRGLP